MLVKLRDGVSLQDGRDAVQAVAERNGAPDVEDREQYIDRVAGQVDQVLILVYGLLGLAIVIALLVMPIVIVMSGAAAAAVLGHFLVQDGEVRNEGSELLDLNV